MDWIWGKYRESRQGGSVGGHFNPIPDQDGVVRSLPLLAEYKGAYYESLALAMFRRLFGSPTVVPGFSEEQGMLRKFQALEKILLVEGKSSLKIPVDKNVATLVPYRGPGGVKGGSYRYVSAADVLFERLPPGSLQDKIILVGTTAPGLNDLRVTPVGEAYPGVESHANVISGWLDNKVTLKPDWALGYDVFILVIAGLALAIGLPLLSAPRAVLLSVGVLSTVTIINTWLYLSFGLVMPLAAAIVMNLTAFALNMSYGYFVETRSKRELAHLFGTYVPPELVDEMVKDPDSYSMKASNRELTVMFCDMRGFTKMSERMEPTQLAGVAHRGVQQTDQHHPGQSWARSTNTWVTVSWHFGVPRWKPAEHAHLAVKACDGDVQCSARNQYRPQGQGLPEIGIGIGLNTGIMCVGDMGSDIRPQPIP
jgi:adenylate cyclase